MNKQAFITFLIVLFCIVKGGSEELPPSNVLKSDGTAEEAISEIDISLPFLSLNGKVKTGVSFGKKVSQKIINAIIRKGEYGKAGVEYSPADVSVYLLSMNIGDPDITEALIEAKNQGAKRVAVIVDGDRGLETNYKDKIRRKHIRDWSDVQFRSGAMGRELKKLAENDFMVNDKQAAYSVYFQPLSKSRHIRSLQHEKGLILKFDTNSGVAPEISRWGRVLKYFRNSKRNVFTHFSQLGHKDLIESYRLTENFTDRGDELDSKGNKRYLSVYNRGYSVVDRTIGEFELAHVQDFIDTVSDGKGFDQMKMNAPQRVEYADGSFIELGYTNGRFNLNSRMEELLRQTLNTGSEGKLKRIVASHFVISNDEVTKTLVEYLNDQIINNDKSPTKLFLVADDSFIDPQRVGLSSLFAGFANKLGADYNNGLSKGAQKNIKAYSFVRKMNNPLNINKPLVGKMLWHDKTTIFLFESWAYIFSGSFNLSDRSANAEYQYMIRVPVESPIVKSFVSSIVTPVRERPHLFLRLDRAVFRTRLARFLGISVRDMDLLKVNKILNAIIKSDYQTVSKLSMQIWKDKQASVSRPLKLSEEAVGRRISMMKMFLSWYGEEVLISSKKKLIAQQVTMLSGVAEKQSIREKNVKGFINSLVGYSDISLEEQELLQLMKSFKDNIKQFTTVKCEGYFAS